MVKKTDFSESTSSSQVRPNGDSAVPKASEIANLLVKADELLEAGEPKKALDLLARSKIQSPWVTNAMAVCQLRLGNAKSAGESATTAVALVPEEKSQTVSGSLSQSSFPLPWSHYVRLLSVKNEVARSSPPKPPLGMKWYFCKMSGWFR